MPVEKDNLTERSNDEVKNFLTVKNSLIAYYQNIASSQAVRLIGFTAGVFTLVGATRLSPEEKLGEFFKGASILILEEGLPASITSSVSLLFLSISIFVLLFFVFRAVFRYTAYNFLIDKLMRVTVQDIKKSNESLYSQVIYATKLLVAGNNKRLLGIMPVSYVISLPEKNDVKRGVFYSFLFSLGSTFLLLLLIW